MSSKEERERMALATSFLSGFHHAVAGSGELSEDEKVGLVKNWENDTQTNPERFKAIRGFDGKVVELGAVDSNYAFQVNGEIVKCVGNTATAAVEELLDKNLFPINYDTITCKDLSAGNRNFVILAGKYS